MTHLRTALVACLFTAACGDVDWQAESVETDEAPITGGTLLTSAQHVAPHTSVIKIQVFLNICTAIKVGTNTYWTAAHCLPLNPVGREIKITNDRSGDLANPQYTTTIATAHVHPSASNYYEGVGEGFSPEYYDIARFTLAASTPNIPAYSTTDTAWVAGDQDVSFTAYGCDTADPSHSGRKQRATIHLATFGELDPDLGADYYAHHFISTQDVPQGCDGDSGAPAFKNVGGTWKIVGTVVHGNVGRTGIVRYGNVRRWLAAPAMNRFELDFRGFLFNQWTGRCISGGVGSLRETYCDGRDQDLDFQSWRLADSGVAGTFYLVNGSSGQCLDLENSNEGSALVQRTCNSRLSAQNTQRWRFDTTNPGTYLEYRRLVNHQTGRCTAPSSPDSATSTVLRSYACSSAEPTWRHQAWVMTR
jgi:hypothetical protein